MDIQTQTDYTVSDVENDTQVTHCDGDGEEEEEEALDPRVQIELNRLNLASVDINRLENELDEARNKYRSIVSESGKKMRVLAQDRKRSIQKAREYYTLLIVAKEVQGEALKAVQQYQAAIGVYRAAKETEALAVSNLTQQTSSASAQITSAWQEMLNHSIEKVMLAEKDKSLKEQEHQRRTAACAEIDSRLRAMEKANPRCIKKAKAYFDLKSEMDTKLLQQKQNVNDLLAAIKTNKTNYTEALRRLEAISEEIHQSRRDKLWSKVPRMPGVGAEAGSVSSCLSEMCEIDDIDGFCDDQSFNLDSDTSSLTSDNYDASLTGSDTGIYVDRLSKPEALAVMRSESSATESPTDVNDDVFASVSKVKISEKCASDNVDKNENTKTEKLDDVCSDKRPEKQLPIDECGTDNKSDNSASSSENEVEAALNMAHIERPSISGEED